MKRISKIENHGNELIFENGGGGGDSECDLDFPFSRSCREIAIVLILYSYRYPAFQTHSFTFKLHCGNNRWKLE